MYNNIKIFNIIGGLFVKLISIIVSVYNKEKFLEKCIQSIIDLKIDKSIIEAIFVDDVSTDNSYKIIKEYAEEYDFIRCIKLSENTGGPAEPRNVGIQEANGEYLTILDADDWLESDGIPKLVYQMRDNDSDIGFGQCYKHRNNEIVKVANFTSYKEDNGLVPYEINKIFRSIGPWAKIFKRSTVFDHNIKFKNLKYAEDKLFYCEIISKSKSASMTSENVYHVNRYTNNISLVKKTNVMEKAEYNLEVLKEIVKMSLPKIATQQILCRIIEMDFISRFFLTKTFLNSNNKEYFYHIFDEVESIVTNLGFEMNRIIENARYKNVYYAYHYNKEDFVEFVDHALNRANKQKYINNHIVHFKYPKKFNNLNEIKSKCTAVYNGTRLINNKFYKVIEVFRQPEVKINFVKLVKKEDERYSKNLDFILDNNFIYVEARYFEFEDYDFNILIQFNDYETTLVNSIYPDSSKNYKLKSQNHKLELLKSNKKNKKKKANKYLKVVPKFVVLIKDSNIYRDLEFKEKISPIYKGRVFEIVSIDKSTKNVPRLVTKEGYYISANLDIVLSLDFDNLVLQ